MRRSRVKSNVKPVQETWYMSWNDGTPQAYIRESEHFSTHSFMDDGVFGNRGSSPPRPDSPCSHVKVTTSNPDYAIDPPKVFTGAGANRFDITPPSGPISFPPDSVPGIPSSIIRKFEQFLQRSHKVFKEQFDERVSLANFLYELKDFKNVLGEAKQIFFGKYGKGGSFLSNLWAVVKNRGEQGVGGNVLDLELNWKAFIGDLPKVFDAYGRAMKRLQFLLEHQRFTTHRRVRYQIPPNTEGFDPVVVVDLSDLSPWLGTYRVILEPAQCQVTLNASAYVENRLQLKDVNAWWALADTLGLNNSPKIIWNAVKLSWVADMFVDTTDFLDAFQVEAYLGSLVVTGGNASYKVVRFYDIVIEWPNDTDIPFVTERTVVGSLRAVNYARTPIGLVKTPNLLGFKDELSTHQKTLLIALGDAQTGSTSRGISYASAYAANFRKNLRTFGRTRWKRVPRLRNS